MSIGRYGPKGGYHRLSRSRGTDGPDGGEVEPKSRQTAFPDRTGFSFTALIAMNPSIPVQRENKVCKYWLTPLALGSSDGFSARELDQIRSQVALNLETILEAWHEYCG